MSYRLTLTPLQLDFYHALLAPFRDEELSQVPARGGKKILTYLDKRALENRLDTVCGPAGWYPQYDATDRGYKCRLHVLVPGAKSEPNQVPSYQGGWEWVAKEDGAGFEEMGSKNRETGEWEADVDNDEKSGYTNALRRAAQDAWGIGRYLYNKGVPGWLDPSNMPLQPGPAQVVENPRQVVTHRHRDIPVESPVTSTPEPAKLTPAPEPPKPAPTPEPPATKPSPVKPIQLPRTGRSAFAWAKEMERTFELRLIQGMVANAKDLGWSETIRDWDVHQTQIICHGLAAYLMTTPKYAGQFDHLADQV